MFLESTIIYLVIEWQAIGFYNYKKAELRQQPCIVFVSIH